MQWNEFNKNQQSILIDLAAGMGIILTTENKEDVMMLYQAKFLQWFSTTSRGDIFTITPDGQQVVGSAYSEFLDKYLKLEQSYIDLSGLILEAIRDNKSKSEEFHELLARAKDIIDMSPTTHSK